MLIIKIQRKSKVMIHFEDSTYKTERTNSSIVLNQYQ